jgi:hypothetical protein
MTDQQREYPKKKPAGYQPQPTASQPVGGDSGLAYENPRTPLPVAGYTSQTDEAIALVNENKLAEERLLRVIDLLVGREQTDPGNAVDQRWVAIAKTHFQEGFMALNRSIFRPTRIALPDDNPAEGTNEPL